MGDACEPLLLQQWELTPVLVMPRIMICRNVHRTFTSTDCVDAMTWHTHTRHHAALDELTRSGNLVWHCKVRTHADSQGCTGLNPVRSYRPSSERIGLPPWTRSPIVQSFGTCPVPCSMGPVIPALATWACPTTLCICICMYIYIYIYIICPALNVPPADMPPGRL